MPVGVSTVMRIVAHEWQHRQMIAGIDEGNADIRSALEDMSLLSEREAFTATRFAGGVSCDAWLVTKADGQQLVVKRALPQLRVKAEWRAPAERSVAEAAWFRLARQVDSKLAPEVLGEAPARNMLAISYYPAHRYPLWKAQLARGETNAAFASAVGEALARLHAATACDASIAAQFAYQAQFLALRLEPYLLYTADRHPDVALRIRILAENIAASRMALMHGDVSPKNILHGPDGPVFLDGETACYGDPPFDLAFCLNHLLLKCLWHPRFASGYLACFDCLARAYLAGVTWEEPSQLERRTSALLPALLLARVDGKSPVEYLMDDGDKAFVRRFAKARLADKVGGLGDLREAWQRTLATR